MADKPATSKVGDTERLVDLIERLGAIALYLRTITQSPDASEWERNA